MYRLVGTGIDTELVNLYSAFLLIIKLSKSYTKSLHYKMSLWGRKCSLVYTTYTSMPYEEVLQIPHAHPRVQATYLEEKGGNNGSGSLFSSSQHSFNLQLQRVEMASD